MPVIIFFHSPRWPPLAYFLLWPTVQNQNIYSVYYDIKHRKTRNPLEPANVLHFFFKKWLKLLFHYKNSCLFIFCIINQLVDPLRLMIKCVNLLRLEALLIFHWPSRDFVLSWLTNWRRGSWCWFLYKTKEHAWSQPVQAHAWGFLVKMRLFGAWWVFLMDLREVDQTALVVLQVTMDVLILLFHCETESLQPIVTCHTQTCQIYD